MSIWSLSGAGAWSALTLPSTTGVTISKWLGFGAMVTTCQFSPFALSASLLGPKCCPKAPASARSRRGGRRRLLRNARATRPEREVEGLLTASQPRVPCSQHGNVICLSPAKQKSPKSPLRPCPPPFLRENFLKPAWCLESRELAHVTGVVLPGSTAGRLTQKTFLGSLHTTAEGGTHLPRGNHCDPSKSQHETGHKREYVRAGSEHAGPLHSFWAWGPDRFYKSKAAVSVGGMSQPVLAHLAADLAQLFALAATSTRARSRSCRLHG